MKTRTATCAALIAILVGLGVFLMGKPPHPASTGDETVESEPVSFSRT
jgi:hypothetical protein